MTQIFVPGWSHLPSWQLMTSPHPESTTIMRTNRKWHGSEVSGHRVTIILFRYTMIMTSVTSDVSVTEKECGKWRRRIKTQKILSVILFHYTTVMTSMVGCFCDRERMWQVTRPECEWLCDTLSSGSGVTRNSEILTGELQTMIFSLHTDRLNQHPDFTFCHSHFLGGRSSHLHH